MGGEREELAHSHAQAPSEDVVATQSVSEQTEANHISDPETGCTVTNGDLSSNSTTHSQTSENLDPHTSKTASLPSAHKKQTFIRNTSLTQQIPPGRVPFEQIIQLACKFYLNIQNYMYSIN